MLYHLDYRTAPMFVRTDPTTSSKLCECMP